MSSKSENRRSLWVINDHKPVWARHCVGTSWIGGSMDAGRQGGPWSGFLVKRCGSDARTICFVTKIDHFLSNFKLQMFWTWQLSALQQGFFHQWGSIGPVCLFCHVAPPTAGEKIEKRLFFMSFLTFLGNWNYSSWITKKTSPIQVHYNSFRATRSATVGQRASQCQMVHKKASPPWGSRNRTFLLYTPNYPKISPRILNKLHLWFLPNVGSTIRILNFFVSHPASGALPTCSAASRAFLDASPPNLQGNLDSWLVSGLPRLSMAMGQQMTCLFFELFCNVHLEKSEY